MGNYKLIKLSVKNLKSRKKHLVVSSILICLTSLVLFLGVSFLVGLKTYYNDTLLNAIGARTIRVNVETSSNDQVIKTFNDLMDEKLIVDWQAFHFSTTMAFNEMALYAKPYNKGIDDSIVYGRPIEKDERQKILLPLYMADVSDIDYTNALLKPNIDMIDSKKLLNQALNLFVHIRDPQTNTLSDEGTYMTFEVVGIYDNATNYLSLEEVFIPLADLLAIKDMRGIPSNNSKYTTFDLVLKDQANKKQVKQVILNEHSHSVFDDGVSYDSLENFTMLSLFVLILNVGILGILTLTYSMTIIKKNLILRKSEFGLLKALGYKKQDVIKIIKFENIILVSVGLLISICAYSIVLKGILLWMRKNTVIYFSIIKFPFQIPLVILTTCTLLGMALWVTKSSLRASQVLEADYLLRSN